MFELYFDEEQKKDFSLLVMISSTTVDSFDDIQTCHRMM
jgi:hypothetical protein